MDDKRYTEVREAKDVTPEVMAIAEYATEFYEDRIEWEDVWDRMDGSTLADGSVLDMGGSSDSAAMRTIKRRINASRQS